MEELINQMRSKFSGGRGQGDQAAAGSSSSFPRDRRIPPQKSLSFKGERKSSNWFQKQFSRQTSGKNIGAEDEVAAIAVAAAAFAVNNTFLESTRAAEREATALARARSRKDSEPPPAASPEPVRSSPRFFGEVSMKDKESPENKAATAPTTPSRDPTLQKRTTFADQLEETEPPKPDTSSPVSPPRPSPSFSDKKTQLRSNSMKPDISPPKPVMFPPIKPATPPSNPPKPRTSTASSRGNNTNADAWERAEISRIKERYDKLTSSILTFEDNQKNKARSKLDTTESELSRKRSKGLQKFKEEMEQINQVAEGARAQAEKRRRNEELKTRDKANKYRTTGKLPRTCFCF